MTTTPSPRSRIAIVATAILFTLTGCSTPNSATPTPTVEAIETPTPTPTATPTPEAAPGTRANPLAVGEMLRVSPNSMWSVGASAATEVNDGYVVLPLHVAFDWEAGAPRGWTQRTTAPTPPTR